MPDLDLCRHWLHNEATQIKLEDKHSVKISADLGDHPDIMRSHRMHSVHMMHSCCYWRSSEVCGRIRKHCKNGWTNQDADWWVYSGRPRNHVLDRGQDFPMEMDNIGGCLGHWKALGVSAMALNAAKKSITVSARLQQPCAMLRNGGCHITLSPCKKSTHPLQCGLSSKFFDHLLITQCLGSSVITYLSSFWLPNVNRSVFDKTKWKRPTVPSLELTTASPYHSFKCNILESLARK